MSIACHTLLATGIGWVLVLALLVLEGFTNLTRLIGFDQAMQAYIDPIDERLWLKLAIAGIPGVILVGLSVFLRWKFLADSNARSNGDNGSSRVFGR